MVCVLTLERIFAKGFSLSGLLGAVFPGLLGAVEDLWGVLAGLLLDGDVGFGGAVGEHRPAEILAIPPDVSVGLVLVLAHQVASFVEEHHRTLGIVDRLGVEIRIERDDLEWEIRRGVGVLFRDEIVEPVVGAAERDGVAEQEHFPLVAFFGEEVDSTVDRRTLIWCGRQRGGHQRKVERHEGEHDRCGVGSELLKECDEHRCGVFPDGGPGGVEYCITLSNNPQHLSQFLTATQVSAKTVPLIKRVKTRRLGS